MKVGIRVGVEDMLARTKLIGPRLRKVKVRIRANGRSRVRINPVRDASQRPGLKAKVEVKMEDWARRQG